MFSNGSAMKTVRIKIGTEPLQKAVSVSLKNLYGGDFLEEKPGL